VPAISLDSSNWKLKGASENLKSLKAEITAFVESDPYRVSVKFEPEPGCHVMRLHIIEEPDPQLGVRVGELVHNLRSALDHIAWQLACLKNSEKVSAKRRRDIYFPVCHTVEQFESFPMLDLIGEPAQAILREFQPYQRGDRPRDHWLAGLNRLWNRDKHRLVHVALTTADVGQTAFAAALLSPEDDSPLSYESLLSHYRDTGIHDNAEIAHLRFERSDPERQHVQVKRHPPAEVFFSADGDNFKLVALGNLCAHVAEVIYRFSGFSEP
jgi:hypothetical protein